MKIELPKNWKEIAGIEPVSYSQVNEAYSYNQKKVMTLKTTSFDHYDNDRINNAILSAVEDYYKSKKAPSHPDGWHKRFTTNKYGIESIIFGYDAIDERICIFDREFKFVFICLYDKDLKNGDYEYHVRDLASNTIVKWTK